MYIHSSSVIPFLFIIVTIADIFAVFLYFDLIFHIACPGHILLQKPKFYDRHIGKPTVQQTLSAWLQHNDASSLVNNSLSLAEAVEICPNP